MDTNKPKRKAIPKRVRDLLWFQYFGRTCAIGKCQCNGYNKLQKLNKQAYLLPKDAVYNGYDKLNEPVKISLEECFSQGDGD